MMMFVSLFVEMNPYNIVVARRGKLYSNEPRPKRTDVDDSYNWSAPKYKKWCACSPLLTLSLAYFAPAPQQSYHKKVSGAIITNIGDNDGWYRLEQGYKIEVGAHWWCDSFWLVNGRELTESSVLDWQELVWKNFVKTVNIFGC